LSLEKWWHFNNRLCFDDHFIFYKQVQSVARLDVYTIIDDGYGDLGLRVKTALP
jgi:hypothetical protein